MRSEFSIERQAHERHQTHLREADNGRLAQEASPQTTMSHRPQWQTRILSALAALAEARQPLHPIAESPCAIARYRAAACNSPHVVL
jgi:hypothetical protein